MTIRPTIDGQRIGDRREDGALLRQVRDALPRPATLLLTLMLVLIGEGAWALDEQRPSAGMPPIADDERANQLADEVFTAEEFWWKRSERVDSPSIVKRFFDALYASVIEPVLTALGDLLEWILDSLSWLFGGGAGGDWSSGIPFLWVVVAGLGAVVVWRIIAMLRRPSELVTATAEVAAESLPAAESLFKQAQESLSASDHRAAIRFAFLALIAHLQDLGKLRYDSSRSNREYLSDLQPWPDLSAVFRSCADPFERCWYGGRQPNASEVDSVFALCRRQLQTGVSEA